MFAASAAAGLPASAQHAPNGPMGKCAGESVCAHVDWLFAYDIRIIKFAYICEFDYSNVIGNPAGANCR